MQWSRITQIVLVMSLFLWFGCAPTSESKPFVITNTTQAMFTVGPKGGSFCEPGGLCLHFPEGAVSKLTPLMGRIASAPRGALGQMYELELKEGTLQKDIRLELPVPDENKKDELVIVFKDGTDWKQVNTI